MRSLCLITPRGYERRVSTIPRRAAPPEGQAKGGFRHAGCETVVLGPMRSPVLHPSSPHQAQPLLQRRASQLRRLERRIPGMGGPIEEGETDRAGDVRPVNRLCQSCNMRSRSATEATTRNDARLRSRGDGGGGSQLWT